MRKIPLIYFLIFLSCSMKNEVNFKTMYNGNGLVQINDLSISTNPPISSTYQIIGNYNDSLFFGLNPYLNPNLISVFDLKNETFLKNIVIDPNFFKSDIMNFHVHSPDSIFFCSYTSKHIYLIDFNGNQINSWNLDNASGKEYPGENGFFFPFNAYNKFFFLKSDNTLVLPIADNRFYSERGDSNLPKVCLFNIEENSISDFIAPPFGRLKTRSNLFYPNDIINPQLVEVDGLLYVAYPFDDEIVVFDLRTGKLLKSKNPMAKSELPLFDPKEEEFMSDREKSWNYRVEMPFFENLSFHKETGLFSRVYHFPYYKDRDKEKNFLRESCIVYFDRNLDFAGKTKFEKGKIGVFRNISLKDGYLIGEGDFLIDSESKLVYNKIYKFN